MSKLKAVAVHFALSFSIVAAVFLMIFTQWYPPPYFQINGATNVLRTLVGVDLVLGPLLTAILYRPNKPGLKFDMAFIAVVQLSALIYGTSILHQERPQFLVFAVDRYAVLPAGDVIAESGVDAIAACVDVPANPCVAVALVPEAADARNELMMQVLDTGIDIERRSDLWVNLSEGAAAVLDRAQPLSKLEAYEPAFSDDIERLREKHRESADRLLLVPVVNKRLQSMFAVIDASSAKLIDVISGDPWEFFAQSNQAELPEPDLSIAPTG